ncbi:agmatinase [Robiginitalea myxolifaciens]|uniref:Agmatinase n=1 Tax=Robiginitalea myxolifaciens TaxID=400055 RepID=A0A1I6HCK4_9FLAO|nr:agmatinase [Robiginitalea myxolifaciens]SFR52202.1 agmatinase [Robiginitalea myxolifaciens]
MTEIGIQGIEFDAHSSYLRGPRLAPPLIRAALHSGSFNMYSENLTWVEPVVEADFEEGKSAVIDLGDFEVSEYFDIEEITTRNLKAREKLLTLGGDHSITYPILKAYAKKYPRFDILQIDAHGDLYEEFEGNKYSHACPFARIMEDGLAGKLVQVGVRTLTPHQAAQAEKFQVEIHQMRNLELQAISKFENPVYLSLDLDGIDPAFAPGVSHHEAGGLSSRQVIELIQGLDVEIIGADIVEYNPERDHQDMTAFLAAKLMKEILAKMI